MPRRALIALGTNLGNRPETFARAIEQLAPRAVAEQLHVSRYYETAPAGGPPGQPAFLNAAVSFETSLAPSELLALLRQIESDLGRVRVERWGVRAIDLDILLIDDHDVGPMIVASAELEVPHPRMAFRRFALEPAADVAPAMRHPVFQKSVRELLDNLNTSPQLVVLLGGTPRQRDELARAVAATRDDTVWLGDFTARADSSGRSAAASLEFPGPAVERIAAAGEFAKEWVLAGFDAGLPANWQDLAPWPAAFSRPRLVALLDDWSAFVGEHQGLEKTHQNAGLSDADVSRIQALRYALRPGPAPVLCVGHDNFQAQRNELQAALVAMR